MFLWAMGASVLAGAAYGSLAAKVSENDPMEGLIIGIVRGLTLSSLLGGTEIFLMRSRVGRVLERAPFLVTIGLKAVVYGVILVGAEAVHLGSRVAGIEEPETRFGSPMAAMSIAFSFAAAFAVLFMLQISRLVGGRTLANIIRGRYHRPRVEERFFLFIDVAGSTGIAERLGPEAVHRFLNRIFVIAGEPIDDHAGEIYQYVGDEIVVTWTADSGRRDARALGCFFAIETALERAAPRFVSDFGVRPGLRAALHAGPVIAGEVGDSKREIVFHGDTMNTASRIEQLTRDLHRRFIVSAEALERMMNAERYQIEDLGPQTLRGRAAPMRVFAVERAKSTT
jgi:adenylate cyclase